MHLGNALVPKFVLPKMVIIAGAGENLMGRSTPVAQESEARDTAGKKQQGNCSRRSLGVSIGSVVMLGACGK